jgi:hypothetical protein
VCVCLFVCVQKKKILHSAQSSIFECVNSVLKDDRRHVFLLFFSALLVCVACVQNMPECCGDVDVVEFCRGVLRQDLYSCTSKASKLSTSSVLLYALALREDLIEDASLLALLVHSSSKLLLYLLYVLLYALAL